LTRRDIQDSRLQAVIVGRQSRTPP